MTARGMSSARDAARFRATLGSFASGITVITAQAPHGPVGMSCQSFFSLSLDPPMVALSPSRASTTWPHLRESGAFCANVLSDQQQHICRAFAVSGGDKYKNVRWQPSAITNSPRLENCLAWIDCLIDRVIEAGDHYLVTAQVIDLEVRDGRPLLFYRGGYGTFTL